MPRTCIVLNPAAGSAADQDAIRNLLAALGGGVTCLQTAASGDAERLAREAAADGHERIIAGGGDGTVNEVLNGIADALDRVELGVLPLGTGNDFARSLGMPHDDPAAAVERLAAWTTRPVDIVRMTATGRDGARADRLFHNSSAGGFVQVVGASADQSAKQSILGPISYLLSAAASLPKLQEYRVRITLEDADALEAGVYATMVCNGRTIGGGLAISPDAALDDGAVNVIVVPAVPLAQLAALGAQVLAGQHRDNPDLIFGRARRVRIDSDPPMPVNADGELLGDTPATYEVLPGALRVVFGAVAPAP